MNLINTLQSSITQLLSSVGDSLSLLSMLSIVPELAEADKLKEKGFQQYEASQFAAALDSWNKALTIYQESQYRIFEKLSSIGEEIKRKDSKIIAYIINPCRLCEAIVNNCLGDGYVSLGQLPQAIDSYQQAVAIVEEMGDRERQASYRIDLGNAFWSLGEVHQAIEFYQQSLDIAEEINYLQAKGRSISSLGNAFWRLGEIHRAIDFYQQSLPIIQEIGDSIGEVYTLTNLANAYESLGQYEQAVNVYRQCLTSVEKIADQKMKAKAATLSNLGIAYLDLGEPQQAIECLQKSVTIAQEINNQQITAYAFGGLGNVYTFLGEYQQAIKYYNQYWQIVQMNQDILGEAISLGCSGGNLLLLGQYEQARDYFQESLTFANKANYRQGKARCLYGLATAYAYIGQYQEALKFYQESLTVAQKTGDRKIEAAVLNGLGGTYQYLGNSKLALDFFKKALIIAQDIKDRQEEATLLSNLGAIYIFLDDYHQALEFNCQSLQVAKEINFIQGIGSALNNLGLNLFKLARLAEAENNLREAIKIWESLRVNLEDTNKVSIFEQQERTYRLLQQVLVAKNRIVDALEIAEQGRTRALAELLIERSYFQLVDCHITKAPSFEEIQQIAGKLNTTLVEYSIIYDRFDIKGETQASASELYIWVINPEGDINFRTHDLKHLQQQEGVSLLDLVIAGLIQGEEQQEITSYSNIEGVEVSNIDEQMFPALRQLLHQLLIEPIADLLPNNPNESVCFIPQRILFFVPFSALQDAEGKFLIEKHTIATASSIQILELTQQSTQVPENSLEALVVGNPKMPTIPLTEPPVELRDLPWAKTEAYAIAPLLNTQAITGATATKACITQQMPKARLIHLATHGLLDDIRQLGIPGAVALAPSDGDNGFLTAGEIYDMKLNAELVVLSACSTGQGKITGDGVVGLSRCLIAAGVKSVIVSLWSVGDLSTALLMVKFYQIFQQGVAAAIALNEAQRWLLGINKTELAAWVKINERFFDATLKMNLRHRLHQLDERAKPFENPRHWAAFCAIGK